MGRCLLDAINRLMRGRRSAGDSRACAADAERSADFAVCALNAARFCVDGCITCVCALVCLCTRYAGAHLRPTHTHTHRFVGLEPIKPLLYGAQKNGKQRPQNMRLSRDVVGIAGGGMADGRTDDLAGVWNCTRVCTRTVSTHTTHTHTHFVC